MLFRMIVLSWLPTLRLVAHQGGWDEMLMVIVPVGAFAALLYGANKRAAKLAEHADDEAGSPLSRDVPTHNERSGPR